MPREHISAAKQAMIFFDLCVVAAAFFMGYAIRDRILDLMPLKDYIGLLPIILTIWGILLLNYFGAYFSLRADKIPEILFSVFKIAALGFVIFGSITYFFKITAISRSLIAMIFSLSAALIGVEKVALIYFLKVIRRKGLNCRNMLVVGTGRRAQKFIDLIDGNTEWGYRIVGLVDADPAQIGKKARGYDVLGTFDDVPDIVHRQVVDDVVCVVPRSWLDRLEKVILFCENEGLNVHVGVNLFELKISSATQTDLNGFPLLSFKTTPDRIWHLLAKRLFDICASGAALVLLAPAFALVALLIRCTSAGPVFFQQERCGLHGRKFKLIKFRTMVLNAEAGLKELMARNEMTGPAFKLKDDPRITTLGRWMRKYSVDELPQLWNVFVGDMSLVGPRPPIPSEVNLYDSWHRRRLSVKPGITCLWQVNGRNKITDFNEWVRLDLQYIDQWSLWLEAKILLKTVPAVMFGTGAK